MTFEACMHRLFLLFEAMSPGDAQTFNCTSDVCYAAVAGRCSDCGEPWSWCGCGTNILDCSCGLNLETGDPRAHAKRLEVRVAELETAIREHQRVVWGEEEVGDDNDQALYQVLEGCGDEKKTFGPERRQGDVDK